MGCNSQQNNHQNASSPLPSYTAGIPATSLGEFEAILENMRTTLNIPGMSVCIVKNNQVVWARGFGLVNRERIQAATAENSYHLASLTKPFAAVLLMQLQEEGKLHLDDRVSNYGVNLDNANVTVRHLLSHTSEGNPGSVYKYNGSRYALLDQVILSSSGKSFCLLLQERIVTPFGLSHTAPDPRIIDNCILDDAEKIAEFNAHMAQGYTSSGQIPIFESDHFSPAAGLISSVLDMAIFSMLMDKNALVSVESREEMYRPTISNSGAELPYGLGWFIDFQEGIKIIWHYGYWDAHSSLIIKIPERDVTFIILANSNMLSRAANNLGVDGDVTRSFVAEEFLNAFIFGTAQLPD
jgi:CubicO group peptidase (beta-lactamase class C family)